MSDEPDVLVVGAGPTGLTVALQAHALGARVRVVERRPALHRPSRAMVVHPRTMEVLRPLGVTDALHAKGDAAPSVHLHLGHRVVPVSLAEFDLPDSAFPYLLLVRQTDVERVLAAALEERGVRVGRGVELVGLRQHGNRCQASLRSSGLTRTVTARYVAGCDGPASTVRTLAGIGWHSAPYGQEVVLADLELEESLTHGVAHVVAARRGLVFLFPVGERATWRLLATRRGSRRGGQDDVPFGQPGPAVPLRELQQLLGATPLPARVTAAPWSARVPLQHGMATRYRCGRLFLAGDAAHSHSPAAAQGMNVGIQDGVNLGWKLAAASRAVPGREPETLLSSYQAERRRVARQVLALTHVVFWAEAGSDPVASFARGVIAPLVAPSLPLLMGRRRLVAEGVRTLSQLRVHYRRSPLSLEGEPRMRGRPVPGDRLPDETVHIEGRGDLVRLHALLAAPGFHALLQREAPVAPPEVLPDRTSVHRVTSWPGSGVVVVRPDGYIGFRCARSDTDQLAPWSALVSGASGQPSGRQQVLGDG